MRANKVKVFSFSGVDGAGKSTQIEALHRRLTESGLTVNIRTFWDDVVVLREFRESASSKVFKGDVGVGSPDRPIIRRDKNVTSAYMVAVRLVLYTLDALRLCIVSTKRAVPRADVIIFDRYIYDELANLPLENALLRLYIRFLLKLVPKPDIGFLIDADPEAAYVRKPEYPLQFVRQNRDAYLKLARVANMIVLSPLSIEEAGAIIEQTVMAQYDAMQPEQMASLTSAPDSAEGNTG